MVIGWTRKCDRCGKMYSGGDLLLDVLEMYYCDDCRRLAVGMRKLF